MSEPAGHPPATGDLEAITAQLRRRPRAVRSIAHRCPCGHPDVVETGPRLDDGSPFPTLFYITCPRLASAIGRLEGSGLMRTMTERLHSDQATARAYRTAHQRYLARRAAIEDVPEIAEVSAGGMPARVKCLHVLTGQALAEGPGVNPFGDQVLELLEPWWENGPCVNPTAQ